MHTTYTYQPETAAQWSKLTRGTIAHQSHTIGLNAAEPLIVAMDALLSYAKEYRAHYNSPLADDGVLGKSWLDAAQGVRALLNGDGAVAMRLDRTTDSKDNGAVESVFWDAMNAAGFKESDL